MLLKSQSLISCIYEAKHFADNDNRYGIIELYFVSGHIIASSYTTLTLLSHTMPPEGGGDQYLDCPDCLKHIHVGTGRIKNLQHHQDGLECCKEQQHLKQGKNLAAQQALLSAFIVAKLCPSQMSPTYAIAALWPLQPAQPLTPAMLTSETTYVPESDSSKIITDGQQQPTLPFMSMIFMSETVHIPERDGSKVAKLI